MNVTNETFYPLEVWLTQYGYLENLEILNVYILIPSSLISFGFNAFSFIILLKSRFLGSVFFSYMKLYVFNAAILSLLCSTTFIAITSKLLNFTNSYSSLFYSIYVFGTLQSILFLYSCLLEICVLIEQSLFFLPKRFKKLYQIEFNKFILFSFLFSVLVNIPLFFFFEPTYEDVKLHGNNSYRIWYMGINNFSFTLMGKIFSYAQYVIRDLVPLLTKIILNLILVYLVRKYLNKIKVEKKIFAQKLANQIKISSSSFNQNSIFISKTDTNQIYIGFMMCFFSFFEHIFYILAYIVYFLKIYDLSHLIFCLAMLSITIKHSFNFFILFKFNNLFRIEVKKMFKFK